MKSKAIELTPIPAFETFPLLRQYSKTKLIVMFISEREGMVVNSSGGAYSLGYYSDDWMPFSSDGWKPFHGKVELSND